MKLKARAIPDIAYSLFVPIVAEIGSASRVACFFLELRELFGDGARLRFIHTPSQTFPEPWGAGQEAHAAPQCNLNGGMDNALSLGSQRFIARAFQNQTRPLLSVLGTPAFALP